MNEAPPDGELTLTARDAWFVPRERPGWPSDLIDRLQAAGGLTPAARRVRAGSALFREGSPAQAVYLVGAGTFKSAHIAEDGYEQVLDFAGRGDVLGYDAVCRMQHPTTAVALEDSTVYGLEFQALLRSCHANPSLDGALHRALSRQLAHQIEIADLMAAVSAEVRLARFLLQFSERMADSGQSARRLLLRMSRRDIASHIGVAHETVSRSFGALVEWGCLAVRKREVEILDRARLRACASSTRGVLDTRPPRSRRGMVEVQAATA